MEASLRAGSIRRWTIARMLTAGYVSTMLAIVVIGGSAYARIGALLR
jgi:hypothetical protein